MNICEACLAAYEEEGIDLENSQALAMAAYFGSDLPDHLCDEIEEGQGPRCDCACSLPEKKKQRREQHY